MNLIDRVKNKVFKCYLKTSVEYHAGGVFIRKQAAYLIFTKDDVVFYYEREEGLRPNDNDYIMLLNNIEQKNFITYNISSISDNVLKLSSENDELKLFASVFIENVFSENLTEVLIDNGNGVTQVFNYVYAVD